MPERISYKIHCKAINPSVHGLGQKHVSSALTVDGDRCPSKELLSEPSGGGCQGHTTLIGRAQLCPASPKHPEHSHHSPVRCCCVWEGASLPVSADKPSLNGRFSSCLALPRGAVRICYLPLPSRSPGGDSALMTPCM